MEKAHHWRQALQFYRLAPLPVSSVSCVQLRCGLSVSCSCCRASVSCSCCHASPATVGCSSGTRSQDKLFLLFVGFGYGICIRTTEKQWTHFPKIPPLNKTLGSELPTQKLLELLPKTPNLTPLLCIPASPPHYNPSWVFTASQYVGGWLHIPHPHEASRFCFPRT